MAVSQERTGGCLCGKVRFRINEPMARVGACHCDMCLRWCGGPMLALQCAGPVEFEGEEHLVRYRSSDWAERGFCGVCGANLFYYLVPKGEYAIAAGVLDDTTGLALTSQIFIDEKPDYYAFANETEKLTGEEVFARFVPEAE